MRLNAILKEERRMEEVVKEIKATAEESYFYSTKIGKHF